MSSQFNDDQSTRYTLKQPQTDPTNLDLEEPQPALDIQLAPSPNKPRIYTHPLGTPPRAHIVTTTPKATPITNTPKATPITNTPKATPAPHPRQARPVQTFQIRPKRATTPTFHENFGTEEAGDGRDENAARDSNMAEGPLTSNNSCPSIPLDNDNGDDNTAEAGAGSDSTNQGKKGENSHPQLKSGESG